MLLLCPGQTKHIFIAPGEHQIVYIIHGLLLAFLIELIEGRQQRGLLGVRERDSETSNEKLSWYKKFGST